MEYRHAVGGAIHAIKAMAATVAPVWVHPEQTINYTNLSSRNGYVATTIAGLVLLALIGWVTSVVSGTIRGEAAIPAIAALLIGLGVGYNSLLTDDWIEEWQRTKSTWLQVVNRVPNIKEGTLILFSRPDEFKALREPLRHRDIFEPAQLFYGLGYRELVGGTVVRPDSRGVPRWILPWLGTGEWQTKKTPGGRFPPAEFRMGWGLLQPTDVVVDRQRILILDETEGCVKVLDNRRHTQDVSSPVLEVPR